MRKTDGRKLSHESLEEIRIRAVRQVEAGESPEAVVKALGFARTTIYDWIALYREGGDDALRAKPVPGRPPKLNGRQLQWLVRTIADKNPLQFKFEYALWTREMVRELIREKWGIKLSGVSVGRLLHKLGFSPQRPLHRAYEQDPIAVARWRRKDFPKIQKMAKAHGAEIFFGDEAGVRSDYHAGTTWGAKGVTPVVPATGARVSVNLVSAISAQGSLRFMLVPGRMTAVKFIGFLKRLLHGAKRPIFLILDSHSIHRSAAVKAFVKGTSGMLRLFFLPPYAPELNPDELVWNDLKANSIGRRSLRTGKDIKAAVLRHMRSLQRKPAKVRSFFREGHVAYAA
jgi:transposase